MNIEEALKQRSGNRCELCSSDGGLTILEVAPSDGSAEQSVLICNTCSDLLSDTPSERVEHWRCLNDSAWSPVVAVQVLAYRQLKKLTTEGWAQNLLDSVYLEPEVEAWVEATQQSSEESSVVDSNGVALVAGDTVTIIKDLNVKGAGFTAKRGTTVKNISVGDDPTHIEGRVNGVRIMLKTCFLKKL